MWMPYSTPPMNLYLRIRPSQRLKWPPCCRMHIRRQCVHYRVDSMSTLRWVRPHIKRLLCSPVQNYLKRIPTPSNKLCWISIIVSIGFRIVRIDYQSNINAKWLCWSRPSWMSSRRSCRVNVITSKSRGNLKLMLLFNHLNPCTTYTPLNSNKIKLINAPTTIKYMYGVQARMEDWGMYFHKISN